MTASEVNKRLKRLTELATCNRADNAEYEKELKNLAERAVSADFAAKKSKIFKALADSTRLRILGLLSIREMCVCEIMVALNLTQPTASHHLGILENAGLVKDRKEGKWVFYRIAEKELEFVRAAISESTIK